MDHRDYTTKFQEQFDASSECYNNVDETHNKCGDELLIDLVRSRPYIYDKTDKEYKNMQIKENAWIEMAGILNITVSDCQTRWTRLRQRYSRERMLRDQETRSGAGKPMRSKWSLFENINFLGKHMVYRKSITNMNLSQPSTSMYQANDTFINSFQPSTSTHEANNSQANLIIQKEVTLPQTSQTSQNFVIASNISGLELERPWTPSPHLSDSLSVNKQVDLIPTPTNNSDMQPAQILTPPLSQSVALTRSTISSERSTVSSPQRSFTPSERSATSSPQQTAASFWHRPTASSFQQSAMSLDSDSEILSPPSTCYINNNKSLKKRKIEPIESAFSQINTTLSTMATQILSKNNSSNNDDSDDLIGKLVTVELKKASEPKKSILKKKFMEILYFSDNL